MYDGGGIYSLGPQSNEADGLANGLRVTQNTIHNQGGIGNILYSDGGSRWITIQDNNSFNNLRELELYYDQKAMYVPDWGGCSPYGDLVFANNTLGNVESRSPNFRCAPQDPEPWANDFELPFNTEYYDNQFTTTHTRSLKKANTSDERHQRVNSFAEGTIKSFSVKGREISFSLSSAGDVIIKRDSTQEKLKLVSSTGNKIDNWLNNELTKVRLPEGEYHIVTLPEDNNLLSSFRTKISSSNANIYQISARTSTVEIETAPYIKTTILTYSRNNHAEKLVLKSQNDTEIAKSESWIDHPYHWQTLRAFIDTNQNLPTPQTRAILSDLPGGSFIIETSERSSTNTIVVTSPQRASI